MKKTFAATLAVSVWMLSHATGWAQTATVKGLYGVGSITTNGVGTTPGVSGRYWSDYLGGELGVRYASLKADIEGTDIIDESEFGVGAALLAGIPLDNLKPHLTLGVFYGTTGDELNDIDTREFNLTAGLGLDIAASDRILIGLDVFQLSLALSGQVKTAGNEADFDGTAFSAFSGVRVGYRF